MNKYLVAQPAWALPVLYQLCRDLRDLGEKVCLTSLVLTRHFILTYDASGCSSRPTIICFRSALKRTRCL